MSATVRERVGEPHYWIEILFGSIKNTNFVRAFEYFPLLRSILRSAMSMKLLPRRVYELRAKMTGYANEKLERYAVDCFLLHILPFYLISFFLLNFFLPFSFVEQREKKFNLQQIRMVLTGMSRRLAKPPPRVDFLQRMISERDDWSGQAFEQLQMQASLLTVAGSETTATALSGITYYLCRDPVAYQKLTAEIRAAFTTFDEINGRATEQLPYLRAVIDEGLRLYPPIAAGLPRISPGEVVDGYFIPKGAIVNVNTWVAGHVESNFHGAFEFRPERWLDPDCKDDKAASQPFLLGSRVCLGRQYVFSSCP
jgi:cytochrome P450